jgi:hypothetical protein
MTTKSPSWYFWAASGALISGIVIYVHGILAGQLLNPSDPEDMCSGMTLGTPPLSSSFFPLSQRCLLSDGGHTELVPMLINPLVVIFGVLFVVWLMLGVQAFELKQATHEPRS